MEIFKNIDFLVGSKKIHNKPFNAFNPTIINFLSQLSKNIQINKKAKNFPDVLTFAFFCREKNLLNLKKNYLDSNIRKGLGLAFHITPSNIPTNFAYSLIFGLLTGNINIVRIPSKKFPQVNIICKEINRTLKKFSKLKNSIKVISYSKETEFTKKISLISDTRLIWGGDKTIYDAKKFVTKVGNRDFYFADKNSICVINYDRFKKLDNKEIKLLANNFYNDTFLVDQNACSSPQVVFWLSKKKIEKKIISQFWEKLNSIVDDKYDLNFSASFFKYERSVQDFLDKKNIDIIKSRNSNIYRVQFKKNSLSLEEMKAKWGYFYETRIKNFDEIFEYTKDSTQTLTYFGFDKIDLNNFFLDRDYRGIDRVVKVGQALSVGLLWDGYDIISNLTRVVDVK